MPSNHLILCRPLLLLPSVFPSIRVFSYESVFPIRWPKYWSFSFSISPSNDYSGWISSRMDWLDLLAVQGTFKSLLQHHSSKASILWHLAFFIVQLSHPYMTTGKTIALTRLPAYWCCKQTWQQWRMPDWQVWRLTLSVHRTAHSPASPSISFCHHPTGERCFSPDHIIPSRISCFLQGKNIKPEIKT